MFTWRKERQTERKRKAELFRHWDWKFFGDPPACFGCAELISATGGVIGACPDCKRRAKLEDEKQ